MSNRAVIEVATLAGMATLAMGCGYTSEYLPPRDGRPRVVMMGTELALVANVEPTVGCAAAAAKLVSADPQKSRVPRVFDGGGGTLTNTNLNLGSGKIVAATIHPPSLPPLPGGGATRVVVPPGFGGVHLGGGLHGGGGGGGGGFRMSGDMGKGAIIIPIIAMTALSWIALGLALGRPESEAKAAATIDEANSQRDLARIFGSPCDEAGILR